MRFIPFISRIGLGVSALALMINMSPPAVAQAWKVDPSTLTSIQTKLNDLSTQVVLLAAQVKAIPPNTSAQIAGAFVTCGAGCAPESAFHS
jgi:hypothetical protein